MGGGRSRPPPLWDAGPNGRRLRWRHRSAAQRWGHHRERHLLQHGQPQPKKEVSSLEEFAPRFLDGHARANRQKPSGIVAEESILRVHLIPLLGSRRLDEITTEGVQEVKRHLADRSPKTVNNVLTVLNTLLRKAVEWDVIEQMPCTIRLLPVPKPSVGFYDFDEYERLVEAAKNLGSDAHLVVLLGGEAGYDAARSSHWNGATWISANGNCAWRGPSGAATSRSRREAGCAMCR